MKVLFASSEVWPLIKTGGLGDVAYSLPQALQQQGVDIRIVLPAYQEVLKQLDSFEILGWLSLTLAGKEHCVRILQSHPKKFSMPLWLVDCQALFDRAGNPYSNEEGHDWHDNAERFALFSLAVAKLGMDALNLNWKPDVVHAHDWQTGLVPAFLDNEIDRPKRVFTIHNLAYGGYFPLQEFQRLQLPSQWWSSEGIEFYGNMSMIKAGIIYADEVTTVSPSYAKEICTAEFGYGLEGVLLHRQYKLTGILNGIDPDAWNPQTDPLLPHHYSAEQSSLGKQKNKQALLESNGIEATDDNLAAPLLGMVSRLVEQKGVDMIIEAIPQLLENSNANFIFIGTGHPHIEAQLLKLSEQHPQRIMVSIEYSEKKAHLLEAGCDLFMMPSRFEPCGLNQLYSLRYGTLPIVHRTGGLADTVVNTYFIEPEHEKINSDATGFVFDNATTDEFLKTTQYALSIFSQKKRWNQIQHNAMQQDYSWDKSALEYLRLYS
ncbi:MAG: glycogen synthase GlgA [Cocleimonas sp.]|nr:glycogen synthase GlgA [Cocleimonas sp.]